MEIEKKTNIKNQNNNALDRLASIQTFLSFSGMKRLVSELNTIRRERQEQQ